jgi:Mg-chelatase subunit ChlD
MKTKVKCLLFLFVLFAPLMTMAQAVININVAEGPYPFSLPFGVNIPPASPKTIGVQGAAATVLWDYDDKPTAAPGYVETPRGFTAHGLTVELPADPGAPITSAETVKITGTPTVTGTFSFELIVANEDASASRTREISVTISRDLQVVLVLDRSGSMGASLSTMTRWDALKNAVGSFVNKYQALNRPADQISVTYFDTDVTPASACCNGFVAVNAGVQGTITTDLGANNPGGWTNLGKGIQVSQTKLSDANKGRSIVIFTDGEQNQDPMVSDNGQSIGGTPIPNSPGSVKMYTVGLYGPGVMNQMLQDLAGHTGGTYNHSETGNDLEAAFDAALTSMLAGSSPQLITRSNTKITAGGGMQKLQEFTLNNRVDKLMLEFKFDKKFEINQLLHAIYQIKILHDSTNVTFKAKPSYAGNYTNSLLLTYYFKGDDESWFKPEGKWQVFMSDSIAKVSQVLLSSFADDHNFHMNRTLGNPRPKVQDKYPISIQLDWLGHAIKSATVEAIIAGPGGDLGNMLGTNPFTAKLSGAQDAGSPGQQKFEQLLANDSAFRNQLLNKSNNVFALNHTSNGKYEGTFDGLTVSGTYNLLIRIKAVDSAGGTIERLHTESFYTSFAGVDPAKSSITTSIVNGILTMTIKPVTTYKDFLIGPGFGSSFTVSNPEIKIDSVVDNQDGSYVITFSGKIDGNTTLSVAGQDIYTGKLQDAGKSGSIIDKIKEWLKSLGLPAWTIWLILLLIILLIWLAIRRKKK